MADVDQAIKLKKVIKKLMWVYHKFYKNAKELREDLEHTPDEIAKTLNKRIIDIQQKTLEKPQANQWRETLEVGIWVTTKDTAYEEQRDYFLYKLLTEDRETLLKHLEEKRKIIDFTDPDNWHVNRWYKSKQITQQMKDEGLIVDGMVSPEESEFVNEKHSEDVKNYILEKRKKQTKKIK